jgi:hypothetical protein
MAEVKADKKGKVEERGKVEEKRRMKLVGAGQFGASGASCGPSYLDKKMNGKWHSDLHSPFTIRTKRTRARTRTNGIERSSRG